MHSTPLYKRFHKVHHNYNHPISLAAEYFHPVDYFFISLLPAVLGPNLLGRNLHITTYMAWIFFQTAEAVDSHSGYEFPFGPFRLLPFSGSATYHDFHHTNNQGNFSSYFTVLDSVFGSNFDYFTNKNTKSDTIK